MSLKKVLFTPGPLTTSRNVKMSMTYDYGSREIGFINLTHDIRKRLLKLTNLCDSHTVVPIQGSGTFAIESTITSLIPPNQKLFILINGAYGRRMHEIAKKANIETVILECQENTTFDLAEIKKKLIENNEINFVAIVHCETTTGVLNQLNDIAKLVKSLNRKLIVDAISSFGAVPIDFIQTPITALVFSSNKGLESVPGLAFVLVEIEHIRKCEGLSNSISLDLFDQWKEFESSGQWRFTPPVQVMLALNTALDYLEKEGGIEKRHKRYSENAQKIISGMKNLGFQSYVRPELQSPVIVTFLFEDVLPFNFIELYNYLYSNNLVIYPGKLTKLNSFRIGCIGQITDKDIKRLIFFIKKFLLLKN